MLSDAFQVKNRRMGFESVEMKEYFQKMRGGGPRKLTRKPLSEIFFAWVGGFVGIYAVWWLNNFIGIQNDANMFLIGSFGASAVLIYGVPMGELSQPRNLVGGHVISALVGVIAYNSFLVQYTFGGCHGGLMCHCRHAGDEYDASTRRRDSPDCRHRRRFGSQAWLDVCFFSCSDRGADHAVDCGDREQFFEEQGPALSEILDLKNREKRMSSGLYGHIVE